MRNNQTTVLVTGFLLIGLMLACELPGSKSLSGERTEKTNPTADNRSFTATPKPAPADCPQATLSVDEIKNKALEKYAGCVVSVNGKIWEIQSSSIALINTTERTGYSDSAYISGDFSNDEYYEIGRKIADLKLDSQFEKLPAATFTGTVDSDGWLKNCVLTDVQK